MCKNKQFILVGKKKMFEKKKWFTITQIVKTSFHLEKYSEKKIETRAAEKELSIYNYDNSEC